MAFAPRTVNKMQLRKSNRILSGLSLADKLFEFYEENKKALFMVQMIKQREKLKFHYNLLKYQKKEASKYLNDIIENKEKADECMKKVDEEFEKNDIVIDLDTEKDDVERDTIEFLCNLMAETSKLDININDINTPRQSIMENKIIEIKNSVEAKNNTPQVQPDRSINFNS